MSTSASNMAGGAQALSSLPPLMAALGRRLPAYPGALLCVAALNLVFPKSRQAIVYEMHHLDLLSRPEVYQRLRRWLA